MAAFGLIARCFAYHYHMFETLLLQMEKNLLDSVYLNFFFICNNGNSMCISTFFYLVSELKKSVLLIVRLSLACYLIHLVVIYLHCILNTVYMQMMQT